MAKMLGTAAWDGLFCRCCNDRRSNHQQRSRERSSWRRVEAAQADPWLPRAGEVRPPRFLPMEADDAQFGYWSTVQDLDYYLNEQARPYLADAVEES
ncbi:hypothetical protein [Nocardia spumae]|uniref:hypothetical protein n=1 Tax=Nocardia spumae TaxID=2887190 RepID=UPI001D148B7A|nr:hypothetical protein [Nocardia spumae]